MPEELVKSSTTNEVLKTSIDALTKLTDIQLGHVNETLKDLKGLMSGFATKSELEETKKDFNNSIKRIEAAFNQHNKDDKISFEGITRGQERLRDTILRWGAIMGAILTIGLPILTAVILHYWFGISN